MITAQELADWRSYANWSTDMMVEQDFLLSRAVDAIFADKWLGGQVAMRGGTILHKSHLAPASRYSEDIDLVLITDAAGTSIQKALKRVLKPLLREPTESILTDIQLAVRNLFMRSKIVRQTYHYAPEDPTAALGTLKVEANINETRPCFNIVEKPMEVPDGKGATKIIQVKSYDLDEMLGTKLRALLQREHGRDLYDLWRAWVVSESSNSTTKVQPIRVAEAFSFYMKRENSKLPRSEIQREMQRRMSSTKFLNDMTGYLPEGVTYSPQQAYEVFNDVYLPHLDAS